MKTIASPYLLSFVETCISQGANEAEIFSFIPGGKKALNTLRMRFPVQCLLDILALTEKTTDTPEIGLLAAKKIIPSSFVDIGNAIMFCQTLRQAITLNCHYQAITQQIGRASFKVHDDKSYLYWDTGQTDPEAYRNITDAVTAYQIQFARWLGWEPNPKIDAIHFRHKKPAYANLYTDVFDCPVVFSQPRDVIISDSAALDLPRPQANASMLKNICVRLDTVLQVIEGATTYSARVEQYVRNTLPHKLPGLASAANMFNISDRSLKRRLKDENTSFRDIMEKTRKSLCEHYMLERKLPFSEIANQLGYSEQSAFNRAFRTWYGQSPTRYIRTLELLDTTSDQST